MTPAAKTEPQPDKAADTEPLPKTSEPVARFTTKRDDRRKVEVDGRFYELRAIEDYGIGAQQRLNRDGREFGQLWNSTEDLDEDQSRHLKFLLDRIFDGDAQVAALLDAPKTVRRALDDAARVELVLDFIYTPLRKMMAAAAQTEMAAEARDSESISTS